jgi:hypothetical protein
MSLMSNIKKTVLGGRPASVKTSGTVTDVFGHRFVVQTSNGKVLADIGPKATIKLSPHERVEIEGEQKPTEIKVMRIAIGGGAARDTHHGDPKHKKHHGHADGSFGPSEAAAMAQAEGYELLEDVRPHKKHFEALAAKGDRTFAIHVHRDGRVEAKPEVGARPPAA